MRVADDEVGEVSEPLHLTQCLCRPLKTSQQVVQRSDDDEFCRIGILEVFPAAHESPIKVLYDRPYRDDEHHGGDDRYRLRPVWDGAIYVVVSADERIEKRQRPESDQRKFMAVERSLRRERQEIVGDCETGRGD